MIKLPTKGMKTHTFLQRQQWVLIAIVAIFFSSVSLIAPVQAADTIQVTATVPAALPSGPAIITYPHDQDHFTSPVVTVLGTCPDDTYVELDRNGIFSGVALCINNTFTIPITLLPGANQLEARVFNLTNNEGPQSPAITVYYDLPQPPVTPPTQPQPTISTPTILKTPTLGLPLSPYIEPLLVTSHYSYLTRFTGQSWSWNISIMGGISPYKMTINWDDQTTSTFPHLTTGPRITHTYAKAGLYHPLITITDTNGTVAVLQLLAVVKNPNDIMSFIQLTQWQQYAWLLVLVGTVTLTLFLLEKRGHIRRRRR